MIGYVISYVNPDTDSVCCSLAYCLYQMKKGNSFKAFIAGNILEETKYVLQKSDIDEDLITDKFDENAKIVIVDTHNELQIPHLKKYENVIEIIDHHLDGNEKIFNNAKIINKKVGAAASILFNLIQEENLMDSQMAILLGSAIISNTLNFCTPSTTEYDKDAYKKICKYYSFSDVFIKNLFAEKDKIFNKNAKEIVEMDLKKFHLADKVLLLGQLEVLDADALLKCFNLKDEMLSKIKNNDCDAIILNIIDVIRKKSLLLAYDDFSLEILASIFSEKKIENMTLFEQILLRKTDFIPKLKELYEVI